MFKWIDFSKVSLQETIHYDWLCDWKYLYKKIIICSGKAHTFRIWHIIQEERTYKSLSMQNLDKYSHYLLLTWMVLLPASLQTFEGMGSITFSSWLLGMLLGSSAWGKGYYYPVGHRTIWFNTPAEENSRLLF